MSLMWLSNTNIKKLKRPKPNEKRGREPSPAERENPCRSEPMPSFSPPSCRPCPDGALVVPPHCSIWACLSLAKLQPSFFLNSSQTQAPSLHCWPISTFVFLFRYGFWRLCLCFKVDFGLCVCFDMGFDVCVCVLAWISSWVSSFVCISGLGFGLSLHFELGFCWLFNLLFSIWVAHIFARFF